MNTEPTPATEDDTGELPGLHERGLSAALKRVGARVHARAEARRAQEMQREEPAPPPLPLVDEEELAQIADPQRRAERRRYKEQMYQQFPKARAMAEENSAALKAEREKDSQLPLWPESVRGTPNSFLRGALFAAIQGKERRYIKGVVLAAQPGVEIRFTGMQLDQFDLDVWEQAVQLAAKHPLGNVCHFKIKAFLRELGRHDGKTDREGLMDSFRRLMSSGVEIKHGPVTYGGSMLEFWHDEESDTYKLQQNPRILSLYKAGWTAIDWETRLKLRRKPLALWLFGWLSSNAENYPTKVETIRQLSGSRNPHKGSFKRQLATALSELQAAAVITAWAIDPEKDTVSVERTPSGPQQRYLLRKLTKPRKP